MSLTISRKKQFRRERRKKRMRVKIKRTSSRPRLSVYRSLKHIYAQIIDDQQGITLVNASDLELPQGSKPKKKSEVAHAVGELIAQKARKKKISDVVFDRGGLAFKGRIKELAEGARKGGLNF